MVLAFIIDDIICSSLYSSFGLRFGTSTPIFRLIWRSGRVLGSYLWVWLIHWLRPFFWFWHFSSQCMMQCVLALHRYTVDLGWDLYSDLLVCVTPPRPTVTLRAGDTYALSPHSLRWYSISGLLHTRGCCQVLPTRSRRPRRTCFQCLLLLFP